MIDNRISCEQCRCLDGRICRAERGDVGERYGPVLELLHRCPHFAPLRGAADQRTGRERYPLLWEEYAAAQAERNGFRRDAAARGVERAKAALAATGQ